MKFAFVLFISLALALAIAIPAEEHLVSEDAKSTIAELLQVGKTKNACKDLAKASIKEVNDAIKAAQKIISTFDDGSKCKDKGKSLIDSSKSALKKAQGKHNDGTKAAQQACTAPVQFASVSLSNLKDGKCAVLQKDPALKKAKAKCTETTKAVETGKGAVQAAQKGVTTAEKLAKDAKRKCDCAAQEAHKKLVQAAKKANSKANKDAWDKAHNMECVLDGKNKCKFKGVPTVKVPKMDARVAKVKCMSKPKKGVSKPATTKKEVKKGIPLPDYSTAGSGQPKCSNFRVLPHACGGGNVAFAMSKSNKFLSGQVYSCPTGWYWAKTKQYFDFLKNKYSCYAGSKNSISSGWAMYGQCGWNGFTPPRPADQVKHEGFIFADTSDLRRCQNAGKRLGDDEGFNGVFAGIVCMKNGY